MATDVLAILGAFFSREFFFLSLHAIWIANRDGEESISSH